MTGPWRRQERLDWGRFDQQMATQMAPRKAQPCSSRLHVGHLSFLQSTSWAQSFPVPFYNITIISFHYCADKNPHINHWRWSGVWEFILRLSLGALQPCSLLQHCQRTYCVPSTWLGPGHRDEKGPVLSAKEFAILWKQPALSPISQQQLVLRGGELRTLLVILKRDEMGNMIGHNKEIIQTH